MSKIAIFASGTGSNARKIIEEAGRFNHNGQPAYEVALVISNKPGAGVLGIAAEQGIPTLVIDKETFFRGNGYLDELKASGVDLIVLAGFLWKVPGSLIKAFPKKIINIHPALLPKYGGKGMYGHFVHEAVIAAKEKESGITIHFVDEQYDHGQTILQARCIIEPADTPEMLAKKIQVLEHRHFPSAVALVSTL